MEFAIPKLINATKTTPYSSTGVSLVISIQTLRTTVVWMSLPVYLLGLITNSLNVIIYAMIGFRDNVTINFFALSICDLCYTVMSHNNNVISLLEIVNPGLLEGFDITNNVFAFYASMLLDISVLIKTFIAVQRGCCVAIPFHVNRLLKNKTAVAVILSLGVLCLLPYVNFEFFRIKRYFRNNNVTYVYEMYSRDTKLSEEIRFIFNKIIVVFTSEILVSLSLVVIIYGMKSASKWRRTVVVSETAAHKQPRRAGANLRLNLQKQNHGSSNINDDQQIVNRAAKQNQKRDTREIKVIKQVTLVSVMHLICYTPVVIDSVLYFLIERNKLPFVVWYVHEGLERFNAFINSINAAINFFIYYGYNSKFTQRVPGICRKVQQNQNNA